MERQLERLREVIGNAGGGSELNRRVKTAAAGAAVLMLLIIFGGWIGIYLVTAVLSLGMLYEYSRMVFKLEDQVEKRYALLLLGWFLCVADMLVPRAEFELLLMSFFGLFCLFLYLANRQATQLHAHFRELMAALFGVIYLVFLPLFLPKIHESPHGVQWTILFFLIVWAADTGAYFAGKKYGRRKLYPLISPKKSVEGAIGGVAAGVIVSLLYKILIFRAASWGGALLIPLFVGPFSAIGDLAESFLKRAFDVKDSGSILPGHGGFLDRFDGIVFALPVMYASLRLFG